MASIETPWTTCFLTRMLVLYLEQAGKADAVDYHKILDSLDLLNKVDDPKAFIEDYNNWVPHHVLKKLIQAAEKATGSKEVTYLAAKDYFGRYRSSSLLEIIARLLNNVDQVLHCSGLWAKGYTNYLRLQCLKPLVSDGSEVILLSRFDLKTEPLVGNIHLIRGNYEGFVKLFDHMEDAICTEEISQLKIGSIVKEFRNYKIEEEEDRLSVIETSSNREVAMARMVYLKEEAIPSLFEEDARDGEWVVHPVDAKVKVLIPLVENDPELWRKENKVYEIVQEGTLQTGSFTYPLQKGKFFNAPYSRYRFRWRSKERPKGSREITRARSEIVPLLFDHLNGLRETQKRLLRCTIENKALVEVHKDLTTNLSPNLDFCGIIGKSPKMQRLFDQIRLISQVDSAILITGETGTGKELLARAIHQLSPRKDQKFFAVNCASIAEGLLESELFGHEKGAFTGALSQKKGIFEAADGGTLLLDEVGEISPAMQAKMLRVLEEQEIQRVGGRETIPIDVRILSASNEDLEGLITSGKFRRDLFYRLNVISLTVPPLRERLEDLPLLLDYYLALFSQKCKKTKPVITRETLDLLLTYPWPGNIRQLKNVVERAVVMDIDQEITPQDIVLPEEGLQPLEEKSGGPQPFHKAVKHFKRSVIETALRQAGGNQTKAAELLGLQRTYLVRLMRLLHISAKG